MAKSVRILAAVVLVAVVAVLFTACSDWFVDDDFTYRSGSGELLWNDTRYVEITGVDTAPVKRVLARIPDHTAVCELSEDPSLTFLMVRHAGNTHYVVREDYVVPSEGEVTAFLWGARYVTDEAACNAVEEMLDAVDTMPTFVFETDNFFENNGDAQTLKNMRVAYEGCPVVTDLVGYVGKVNGKLVYVTENTETYVTHPDGSRAPITAVCCEIPQPLATTLASYLKFD